MVHNTNGCIVHMQEWGGQRAFEGREVSLAHGHISQWACCCVLYDPSSLSLLTIADAHNSRFASTPKPL